MATARAVARAANTPRLCAWSLQGDRWEKYAPLWIWIASIVVVGSPSTGLTHNDTTRGFELQLGPKKHRTRAVSKDSKMQRNRGIKLIAAMTPECYWHAVHAARLTALECRGPLSATAKTGAESRINGKQSNSHKWEKTTTTEQLVSLRLSTASSP